MKCAICISLICWVLLLHQPAPSQSSHYADNPFASSKRINTQFCQELCNDMNMNLRKSSPTLAMLLQNAMPLEYKVYGRSNPVYQSKPSILGDTDDFLCNCDTSTKTDSAAPEVKRWMEDILQAKPAPIRARFANKRLRSKSTSNYAENPFIFSKYIKNEESRSKPTSSYAKNPYISSKYIPNRLRSKQCPGMANCTEVKWQE